jgi:hypothetical protein
VHVAWMQYVGVFLLSPRCFARCYSACLFFFPFEATSATYAEKILCVRRCAERFGIESLHTTVDAFSLRCQTNEYQVRITFRYKESTSSYYDTRSLFMYMLCGVYTCQIGIKFKHGIWCRFVPSLAGLMFLLCNDRGSLDDLDAFSFVR